MKRIPGILISAVLVFSELSAGKMCVNAEDSPEAHVMYRLYNPNGGEHFYTADVAERNHTIAAGWKLEGAGWQSPDQGRPVYRLYNRNGGEHHYTLNDKERKKLILAGWKDEGFGWQSGGDVPVYREYNPNAFANNHNFTTSRKEHEHLLSLGWKDEGVAWYATQPATVSIEDDNATVSVSADINMKGTGDGYHSKVVLNSANGSLASFGLQYDTDSHGKGRCRFILENIMNHAAEPGPVGKRYLYAGNAKNGQTYNVRLSWYKDTNELVGYVDGVEIIRDTTTFRILTGARQNFAIAVEGVVKHTGDTIDATYKHIKVRSSIDESIGGLLYGWRNDVANYHRCKNGLRIKLTDPGKGIAGGVFDTGESNYGYDAAMHVYGKGNNGIKGHDWDWVEFYADASWTTHAKLPGQETTPQKRTVTFVPDAEDPSETASVTTVINQSIGKNADGTSKVPVPEKEGYQFAGWYSTADPAQMNDSNIFTDSTIVSDDITVYAKWKPKATAELTFKKNCDSDTVTAPEIFLY